MSYFYAACNSLFRLPPCLNRQNSGRIHLAIATTMKDALLDYFSVIASGSLALRGKEFLPVTVDICYIDKAGDAKTSLEAIEHDKAEAERILLERAPGLKNGILEKAGLTVRYVSLDELAPCENDGCDIIYADILLIPMLPQSAQKHSLIERIHITSDVDPELHRLTVNTHMLWTVRRDKPFSELVEDLKADSYNYNNSMAAAAAIPAKLYSIGIAPDDLVAAARPLEQLLQLTDTRESNPTVEKLLVLEKTRWNVMQICTGKLPASWQDVKKYAFTFTDGKKDRDGNVSERVLQEYRSREEQGANLHPAICSVDPNPRVWLRELFTTANLALLCSEECRLSSEELKRRRELEEMAEGLDELDKQSLDLYRYVVWPLAERANERMNDAIKAIRLTIKDMDPFPTSQITKLGTVCDALSSGAAYAQQDFEKALETLLQTIGCADTYAQLQQRGIREPVEQLRAAAKVVDYKYRPRDHKEGDRVASTKLGLLLLQQQSAGAEGLILQLSPDRSQNILALCRIDPRYAVFMVPSSMSELEFETIELGLREFVSMRNMRCAEKGGLEFIRIPGDTENDWRSGFARIPASYVADMTGAGARFAAAAADRRAIICDDNWFVQNFRGFGEELFAFNRSSKAIVNIAEIFALLSCAKVNEWQIRDLPQIEKNIEHYADAYVQLTTPCGETDEKPDGRYTAMVDHLIATENKNQPLGGSNGETEIVFYSDEYKPYRSAGDEPFTLTVPCDFAEATDLRDIIQALSQFADGDVLTLESTINGDDGTITFGLWCQEAVLEKLRLLTSSPLRNPFAFKIESGDVKNKNKNAKKNAENPHGNATKFSISQRADSIRAPEPGSDAAKAMDFFCDRGLLKKEPGGRYSLTEGSGVFANQGALLEDIIFCACRRAGFADVGLSYKYGPLASPKIQWGMFELDVLCVTQTGRPVVFECKIGTKESKLGSAYGLYQKTQRFGSAFHVKPVFVSTVEEKALYIGQISKRSPGRKIAEKAGVSFITREDMTSQDEHGAVHFDMEKLVQTIRRIAEEE